jgi:hypothetical protein
MRIKRFIIQGCLGLSLVTGTAMAQTCGGFSDVFPTDSFCNSVEWLKNRAITLGCGGGQYCPGQAVLRSSMSLYLERLGTAVAPVTLHHESNFGSGGNNFLACQTTPYLVSGFPRSATVVGSVSLSVHPAAMWSALIEYSTDNFATAGTPLNSFYITTDMLDSLQSTFSVNTDALPLDVGTTYTFAVVTYSPTVTSLSVKGNCEITARVDNRLGTSSPY